MILRRKGFTKLFSVKERKVEMLIYSLGKTLVRNGRETQNHICATDFSLSIILVMCKGIFPDPSASVAINLHFEK